MEARRMRAIRYARVSWPTIRYWMETEVHVYAFSIAANMILSFFPFLIVMVSICQHILRWNAAVNAIYFSLGDYFPDEVGRYISDNLHVTVASQGPFQVASVFLLFFTANGVFEPMEVALNRVWGCKSNRSFLMNQVVSLGLILVCGGLVMASVIFTAVNNQFLTEILGIRGLFFTLLGRALFKLAAIPVTILSLFLIYWLLPNCKVRPRSILPAAVVVGLVLEALKYVNLFTWGWLRHKLTLEYGPFKYAVSLILWGFVASMVILGGAEWASRQTEPLAEPGPGAIDSSPPQ